MGVFINSFFIPAQCKLPVAWMLPWHSSSALTPVSASPGLSIGGRPPVAQVAAGQQPCAWSRTNISAQIHAAEWTGSKLISLVRRLIACSSSYVAWYVWGPTLNEHRELFRWEIVQLDWVDNNMFQLFFLLNLFLVIIFLLLLPCLFC